MYQQAKRVALVSPLLITLVLLLSQSSLAQGDAPSIEDIRVHQKAIIGERVEIVVVAKNGGSYVDRGYITVSFPDARCPDGTFATVEVAKLSSGDTYVIPPPDELLFNKGEPTGEYKTKIKAVYPVAEVAFNPWLPNASNEFRMYVTPCPYPHQMGAYVRVAADSGQYNTRNVVSVPSQYQTDVVDQQGYYVYERFVTIFRAEELPTSTPTPISTLTPIVILTSTFTPDPTVILTSTPIPIPTPVPTSISTPDRSSEPNSADGISWTPIVVAIITSVCGIIAAYIQRGKRDSK